MRRKNKVVITGVFSALFFAAITAISVNSYESVSFAYTAKDVEHHSVIPSVIANQTTSVKVTSSNEATDTNESEPTTSEAKTNASVGSDSPKSADTTAVESSSNVDSTTVISSSWMDTSPRIQPEEKISFTVTQEEKELDASDEDVTADTKATSDYYWDGPVLNSYVGIVSGPSGNETFYNLDMTGVISIMQGLGYDYSYWVRDDGVKMYGEYVMCAADLSIRPRGSLIATSLGMGIVCDTGTFVYWDSTRLDIATTW